ncbi:oligosaccharide flippase family protein [Halococcus salsus]|uniref:oligosaccharide flippase family protein n=1 Tax=Halococcus salsus TaxID=2162894 RepID=UPI00135930C2|nr:oligosaccharide flippase family protein [Halococcus salsus]
MADRPESGISAALRSVVRGAGAQVIGLGVARVLGFIATYLLTRSLGATAYGIYSYGKVLLSITSTISNFGTDQSIVRFVPKYTNDRAAQNRTIGLAIVTSLVGGIIVGLTLYWVAPVISEYTLDRQLLVSILRLFAIALPAMTLIGCISSVFRSLELPGYQILSGNIIRLVFRVLAIGVIVAIGASLVGVVVAEVIATVLALLFGIYLFVRKTDFWPNLHSTSPGYREFYNFSVPLTMTDTGRLLQSRIDILMVGIFLPGSAVGIYNLSSVLSQVLDIPSVALNTIYPSIASRMYSNNERGALEALFTRVTRWTFTLALLPAVGLFIYSSQVLSIFGEGFRAGMAVLSLFVLSSLLNSATGPTEYTLMMTDHQYLLLANRWGGGISNVILNYLFITRYGLIGAVSATVIISAIVDIASLIEVWYTEGLFPYSLTFLKPITAGLACGAALKGWETLSLVSGFPLLIIGAVIGTVTYIISLLVLGIEEEDREFLTDIRSNIT